MDELIYTISKKQILTTKTAKELEALVRKYIKELNVGSLYRAETAEEMITYKLRYKLLVLALQQYTKKSKVRLPDFIYDTRIQAQHHIWAKYIHFQDTIPQCLGPLNSYLVDIFEFDTEVEISMRPTTKMYIERMHKIFKNSPIHFTFVWREAVSNFDRYSTPLSSITQSYVRAIRFKQILSPNKHDTILDQYLAYHKKIYEAIEQTEDIQSALILLVQQQQALETLLQEGLGGHNV